MQPFNPYLQQPMQNNSYTQTLQNQINYLQNQLQQYQNSAQLAQQQTVQSNTVQNVNGINTQLVDDFSSISANSVPMDNNGALFVKKDGTEIQSRRWTPDGKIITIAYFPQIDSETENTSSSEMKLQESTFTNFTDVFNEQINKVFDRLDILEDIITNPRPKRTTKKEVVADE